MLETFYSTGMRRSELAHLKAIVRTQDPQAFVIVMPAQEILGGGFQPLQETGRK